MATHDFGRRRDEPPRSTKSANRGVLPCLTLPSSFRSLVRQMGSVGPSNKPCTKSAIFDVEILYLHVWCSPFSLPQLEIKPFNSNQLYYILKPRYSAFSRDWSNLCSILRIYMLPSCKLLCKHFLGQKFECCLLYTGSLKQGSTVFSLTIQIA